MIPTSIKQKLLFAVLSCFLANWNMTHAACNIINGKGYGDCSNVRINKGIKDRITVRSSSTQSGIIKGAVILKDGHLYLSGISNGDITVRRGGHLMLTGVVNGSVNNLGGLVEIEGMLDHLHNDGGQAIIAGSVGSVTGTGSIEYRKGAVIGGVPIDN